MHFRFVTHLDTLAATAQFHKLVKGDPWAGQTPLAQMTDEAMPHKTLLLRVQNVSSRENWLDDLPMFDQPEYEKWKSMQRLLIQARKAIFADPVLNQMVDAGAPTGRIVISVLKPHSVMAWHSDLGEYAKRHVRFHFVLQTNPLCKLYCGPEMVHAPVGALVFLNSQEQHSAANWGSTLRSHVIFELRRRDAPEGDE